ncbi:hypothetical protein D0865_04379 [Hortaea werneckii]|uniref:non-specific serine/threonine protein kinase n=1 Tax=Hortaea werneckii TaxID=91943 RepID=A0A3M7CSX7_HORWE|nr:hypothetical protein D0865_04379 [Hortaea werneckii]
MATESDAWVSFQLAVKIHEEGRQLTNQEFDRETSQLRRQYEGLTPHYRDTILPHMLSIHELSSMREELDTELAASAEQPISNRLVAFKKCIDNVDEQFLHYNHLFQTLHGVRDPFNTHDYVTSQLSSLRHDSKDLKQNIRQLADDLRREHGASPSWVGAWKFAIDGSFGRTSLWVKQDSSGLINDRCVIKDTVLSVNSWNSKLCFAKDPRYPESDERTLPTEVAAHAALRPLEGSDTIIRMRNWRLASERRMYRLYLEFAPHGDLYQFMTWYNSEMPSMREVSTESEKEIAAVEHFNSLKAFHDSREAKELKWLPEPFIWACFESLAKAGLLMEQGSLDENPLTRWDLIVHFDLKPSNVFLGVPSTTNFTCYPQAKLGDFGLAQLFSPEDDGDYKQYCGRGTVCCRAPEQVLLTLFGRPEKWTSATNVWGIGIIIWGLMELEEGDHRLVYEKGIRDGDSRSSSVPTLRPSTEQRYSKELCDLVDACTEYRPSDRPSFREVLNGIHKRFQDTSTGRGVGAIRSSSKDDRLSFVVQRSFGVKKDGWPLGEELKHWVAPPPGMHAMPSPPFPEDLSTEEEEIGGVEGTELEPLYDDASGESADEEMEIDDSP